MKRDAFYKNMWTIALPVTLQSLLQSSFSMIDQMMIGRLGETNIAGVGLAGKLASMYSVVLGAVAGAAGIMAAQYIGQKNGRELKKSFSLNLSVALLLAVLFLIPCLFMPHALLGLYTNDAPAIVCGAGYLRVYALSFVPMALVSLLSVLLRCMDAAFVPLAAGFAAVGMNTGLNYLLIFGKCGLPVLGVRGAAIASVASQIAALVLLLACSLFVFRKSRGWQLFAGMGDAGIPGAGSEEMDFANAREKEADVCVLTEAGESGGRHLLFGLDRTHWRQYASILLPILICEFLWSLGENIYAGIYGHMGVAACAAMTVTGCVQGLTIGALSGVSQAAGIMIGKQLGDGDEEGAYRDSKRFMICGVAGSLVLSAALILLAGAYVRIYRMEPQVQKLAQQILIAFAIIAPVKVQNMILGGGIIRSGGKTAYVMCIDMVGTWVFGVPLGLLAAFVWRLPIPYVYFVLSLEEVVRFLISLVVFRRRSWMKQLLADQ